MIASFSVFISRRITEVSSVYKHIVCICGKWQEGNRV
jgi:hypothetical protein